MKKSTKSTSSNKAQSARSQRRSTAKTKPVTIDLKAENVSETESKKSAASNTRTGTPKVKKSPAATATTGTPETPSNPKKTESSNAKQTVAKDEKSSFGRNATPTGAKPKPEKAATTPPKETKPKSGRMGRFAAAVIGGGVALGGAALLQGAGVIPTPGSSNPAAVQKLVSAETTVMQTELTALNERIKQLEATANNGGDGGDNSNVDLSEQIDALISKRLAELPKATGDADLDAVITQVNETTLRVEKLLADQATSAKALGDLQSAVETGGAGGGAALSAMSVQVENLQSRASKLGDELGQLKTDVAALVDQSGTQSAAANEELSNRLTAVERLADAMPQITSSLSETQSAVTNNSTAIQQQGEAIAKLSEQANTPNPAEKLAARAVAAAALKNDIDRGQPFDASLQVLQNLSPENSKLSGLLPFAKAGIPTNAQLLSTFDTASEAILAATEAAPGDDLSSRLLAGVKSFVKVKPRKAIEGTTPIAIVSQITKSLQDGDLNAASTLWNTLPEAGRAASADWHSSLTSRITANDLISSTVQSFLNSTATQ